MVFEFAPISVEKVPESHAIQSDSWWAPEVGRSRERNFPRHNSGRRPRYLLRWWWSICLEYRQYTHPLCLPQIEWNTCQRRRKCMYLKCLPRIEWNTCQSHMPHMRLPLFEQNTCQQHTLACHRHRPHSNTQEDITCSLRHPLRLCRCRQSSSDRRYCWRHRKCPRRSWRDISVS